MIRIHHTASAILLGTAALCCAATWSTVFQNLHLVMFGVGFAMLTTLALGMRYVSSTERGLSHQHFLLILACATLLPRIAWVHLVDTIPAADFLEYHNYAVKVATGHIMEYTPTMMVFPFKFFYSILIGALYAITTPLPIVAQYLNIVASAILSYQVYRIGVLAGGERVGRLAGLFFAFWPSQIAFCSVVGQEHVFLVFVLSAVYLLLRLEFITTTRGWIVTALALGSSIALAHVLRPVALILFPTFLLAVFYGLRHVATAWSFRATIITSAVAGFLITFGLCTVPLGRYLNYPVWKSSAGFSLYVGTSPISHGFWAQEHTAIIREHHHDFDAVHAASMAEAKRAVMEHPIDALRLAAVKYMLFWGSDDYGVYFSTDSQAPSTSALAIFRHRDILNLLSEGAYLFILVSASIACWRMRSRTSLTLLLVESVLLLHAAAFSLLEIQSRYHFLVVPLLMIPAAMCWMPSSKRVATS